MSKPKFPLVIEGPPGIADIEIHRYKHGKYTRYRFAHQANGRREIVERSGLDETKQLAEQILTRLANHQVEVNSLSNEDVFIYRRALQAKTGFETPLDQVATEWVRHKSLAGPVDVEEMIRFYLKQHQGVHCRTFDQVYQEFMQGKDAAEQSGDLSAWYVSSLRTRVGKLNKYFSGKPIADVTVETLRAFLSEQSKLRLKSKQNLIEALNTFCAFAKSRRYLPRDFEAFRKEDLLDAKAKVRAKIEIYRPRELNDLLTHAEFEAAAGKQSLTPFLVIAAFAGIRTAELLRLDWEDLKFSSAEVAYVHVSAGKAKTASRRLVPMLPNLRAWLPSDAKRRVGPIWGNGKERFSQAYLHERLNALFLKAGVKAKANALRHSFISYRAAQVQDVEKVAEEAGNSPRVIFSNYRELVTPEDAKEWFGIFPVDAAQQLLEFKTA